MRLGPVSQLHGAQRYSMRPNPLDVDPEQTCDLLGLEQSPSHRRVLAGDLRNPAWEIGAGGIVTAHGESPGGAVADPVVPHQALERRERAPPQLHHRGWRRSSMPRFQPV